MSTMVPEAAVEITCEAEVPKSDPLSCMVEEKASLIAELPLKRTVHYEKSNSKRLSSVSAPSHTDETQHNVLTVQSKPIIQACISVSVSTLTVVPSRRINTSIDLYFLHV